MRASPSQIDVDPAEPLKADQLGREGAIEVVRHLVTHVTTPVVLAINGAWGSGKTTFLQMLEGQLKNGGYNTAFVNAWETDFASDPLIPLVSSITKQSPRGLDETSSGEQLKKVAASLARRSLPALIRIGTAGLINLPDKIEEEIVGVLSSVAEDQLQQFEEEKNSLREFRECLKQWIQDLGETEVAGDEDSNGPQPRLILFVDELDRCRPDYAIAMLERIKHVFNTNGLVFVLGIDRQQLGHSISGVYGASFDGHEYLRRFIDLDYQLPEPEATKVAAMAIGRLSLKQALQGRQSAHNDSELIEDTLRMLILALRPTLRQTLQAVARLRVTLAIAVPENHFLYPDCLTLLTFLRSAMPGKFDDAVHGKRNGFLQFLSQEGWTALKDEPPRLRTLFWSLFVAIESARTDEQLVDEVGIPLQESRLARMIEATGPFEQEYGEAFDAVKRHLDYNSMSRSDSLGYQVCLKRLELAAQFKTR